MRVRLDFNLDAGTGIAIDEQDELTLCMNGRKYWHVLWTIYHEYLRNLYKHDDREAVPIEELHEKLWDILRENNVDLDEVS